MHTILVWHCIFFTLIARGLLYSLSSLSQSQSGSSEDSRRSLIVGVASMVLSLLSSAWFPLDLSAHQDALVLAGNLLAGAHLPLSDTVVKFWFDPKYTAIFV